MISNPKARSSSHPGFSLDDLVTVNGKSKHVSKFARIIKFCDLKMKLRMEDDGDSVPAAEMELYCCDCQVDHIDKKTLPIQ